jgi:hypothetical protein
MIMRNLFRTLPAFLLGAVLVFGALAAGCAGTTGEGFAIYLTDQQPPAPWPPTPTPEITGSPVITATDILSYDRNHHEITLTKSAFDRLASLDVPISGLGFAVCVDKEVIYSGAFWLPISSFAYSGPFIEQPLSTQSAHTVKIELGYPSSSFFQGQDPRSDPRIFDALAGRLVG